METIAPATLAILVVTLAATVAAFNNSSLEDRWIFDPRPILAGRQYERLLTSGFIHGDWLHFAMNAFALYSFGCKVEFVYGLWTFLGIYLGAILGGSALSLFIHRHHEYRALGASGGVCGVMFASIFLVPGGWMTMYPLPLRIPSFLYIVLFLVGSYAAHRKGEDNTGHDAHLGGAITGLLVATALHTRAVLSSPSMFVLVIGLMVVILWLLVFHPFQLPNLFGGGENSDVGGARAREYASNRARRGRRARMDELLDKVSRAGLHSLSKSERQELESLSKEF